MPLWAVCRSEEPARSIGAQPVGAEVSPKELREALAFPEGWGPSEWGPIPYLPDPDFLVQRMEDQWGSLLSYRGLATSAKGTRLTDKLGMLTASPACCCLPLGHPNVGG